MQKSAKIQLMIRPENSHSARIDRDICQIMPKIIIRFDGNKRNYRRNGNNRHAIKSKFDTRDIPSSN